jgi:hypothetical protein
LESGIYQPPISIMARRVGWYFVFVGVVLLAIAFVLAVGGQSSGRMLLGGLGCTLAGAWLVLRSAGVAPAPPPVAAKAKEGGKPPTPPPDKPAARPRGLAGLLRSRSKSKP